MTLPPSVVNGLIGLGVFVVGVLVGRLLAAIARRAPGVRGSPQAKLVVGRLVVVAVGMAALAAGLSVAGVDPGVLLGTAGILSVAIGFASQTSASNLISGMFLLGERPFVVGDIIRVGTTTGEVLSVDMLSVKLRTFDNLFVRVPNETLLKLEIANISHFPIRRVDVMLTVNYGQDMDALREALFELADDNPYVLDEPTPMVIVDEFLDVAVRVRFSAWAARERFIDAKNALLDDIQREIYAGRFGPPVSLRVAAGTVAQEVLEARTASDDEVG